MKMKTIGASIALSVGLVAASNAALIHAGGNVTLVSASAFAGGTLITSASDGNSASTANGQVYTTDPGGFPSDYFANAPAIVFDLNLGSVNNFDSVAFWNRGSVGNNAVSAFNVVFSTDSIFGNGDDSVAFNFNPTNTGGAQQNFALASVVTNAQYVRVSITDNFYNPASPGSGGDRTGFTEFQFNTTAVPEPSATALLGLGGLALILRRRK